MSEWENNVRKVVPYTPGEQPKRAGIIKLNTNENPFPPSVKVYEALEAFSADSLRLYPDPKASDLVHAIASFYNLSDEEVFVGVGSDDVLAMSFMTFFNAADKKILFPDITYSFYDVWAEMLRIPYETIPLDDRFMIRPRDYLRENGGIVFPNPNAPTGQSMKPEAIEEIIAGNPESVVIVDEAYVDFGAKSVLPLIRRYDNLLVVQTFSKSRSLAGLRVGFAMGGKKLIRYLNDVKYSFNSYTLNRPTIEAASAAISDRGHFEGCCAEIMAIREEAEKMLHSLGFIFQHSDANFLFVTHPEKSAEELFARLREMGIYVRWFNRPRIRNYLRITIGSREDMNALYEALKTILETRP